MRRLTLSSVKAEVADILGISEINATGLAKIKRRINEAQERLLNRADVPVGATMRYSVCTGSSACLTWPRQVRTIEAFWLCNTPGLVVSHWYEALGWNEGGYGMLESDGSDGKLLINHEEACSFDNITATSAAPKKIQAVAASAVDDGKTIHLRYLDANGNRKYVAEAGEGETLTLSTSGVLTSANVATNGLYHVIKAVTEFPVRLYSYDVTTGEQDKLLAVYEPSETEPIYRRTLVPGLVEAGSCSGASDDCTVSKRVTILARVQHIPVVYDNDPLVLTNLPALLDMVKSIQLRRDNYIGEADTWEARAVRELDGEMAAYMGSGVHMRPRYPDIGTWGGGGIFNPY